MTNTNPSKETSESGANRETPPPMSGLDAYPTLSAPTKMIGRYRILRMLGQGGMGTVYLAHDPAMERNVALKVPNDELLKDSDALERFRREVRAACRLEHPNICRIYNLDEIGGTPFMTMAYVDGKPLSAYIPDVSADHSRCIDIVCKLCLAMEKAHAAGIIHRDLKPHNIMIDKDGEPVIMDFGLARIAQAPSASVVGQLIGTLHYMPPEQAKGEVDKVGPWSDTYSLGVILYELLTGKLPFPGKGLAVLVEVAEKAPPPPSQHIAIDPGLESICLRALAKPTSSRFRDMSEMYAALEAHICGTSTAKSVAEPTSEEQRVVREVLTDLQTWGLEEGLARIRLKLRATADRESTERREAIAAWIAGDSALEEKLSAWKAMPEWGELWGWSCLGRLQAALTRYDSIAARAQAEELKQLPASASPCLKANLGYLKGLIHQRSRQWSEALPVLHASLELLGQRHFLTGRVLRALGRVYEGKSNYHASREFFNQAILVQQDTRDDRGMMLSYEEFGRVLLLWGNLKEAERCLSEGYKLARRLADRNGQAQLLNHLGRVAIARAEQEERAGHKADARKLLAEAAEFLESSARHNREHNRPVELARVLKDQVLLNVALGDSARADAAAHEAIAILDPGLHPRATAEVRHAVGNLRKFQGRYDEAVEHLQMALAHFVESNDRDEQARTYLDLARTQLAQGALRRFVSEAFENALDQAEASRCSHLVDLVERELKEFDPEAHWRRVFRRLRGPSAPEQTSNLESGKSESLTALFFNLSEFVPYCQGMDPQEVMLTLNQLLADLAAAMVPLGGEVASYLGGGFIAVFREPGHAERAVHAALDLLAVMEDFNRPRHVLGLRTMQARMSVASGPAWIGNIGTYQKMSFTAIGIPLNLAARLVRLAKPMTVCLSQETYELTQDQFQFHADSPRTVDILNMGAKQVWDVEGRKHGSSARLRSLRITRSLY